MSYNQNGEWNCRPNGHADCVCWGFAARGCASARAFSVKHAPAPPVRRFSFRKQCWQMWLSKSRGSSAALPQKEQRANSLVEFAGRDRCGILTSVHGTQCHRPRAIPSRPGIHGKAKTGREKTLGILCWICAGADPKEGAESGVVHPGRGWGAVPQPSPVARALREAPGLPACSRSA